MKTWTNTILMVCVMALFGACKNDDDSTASPPLVGQWQLVEQLMDPGDGSGSFAPVDSEKKITFNADGSFSCNGNICELSGTAEVPTYGTYSLPDSTLYPEQCTQPVFPYTFEVDGAFLIISYPCIEACRMKYEKQY